MSNAPLGAPWFLWVDGTALAYRAFHALPPLSHQGKPVQAMLGMLNMLQALLERHQPQYGAIIFDAPDGTARRKAAYAEYKSHRLKAPSELIQQIEALQLLLSDAGWPVIQHPGDEADDVMATLARSASERGWSSILVTSDKDMAQVVAFPQCYLWDEKQKTTLGRQGVFEKYGVYPEQIQSYLALRGDASDHIPGVAGIGDKLAVKLLERFGSLERIYEDLSAVEKLPWRGAAALHQKLLQSQASAHLSYALVALQSRLPLEFSLERYTLGLANSEALKTHFERYGFRAWLQRLQKEATVLGRPLKPSAVLVQSSDAPVRSIDLEPMELELFFQSLAPDATLWMDGWEGWTLFRSGTRCALWSHASPEALPTAGWPPSGRLALWNAKPFCKKLLQAGRPLPNSIWDASLVAYLMEGMLDHGIEKAAQQWVSPVELAFQGLEASSLCTLWLPEAKEALKRSFELQSLEAHFRSDKDYEARWLPLLEQVEFPLIPILAAMEHHGVGVHVERMSEMASQLQQKLKCLQAEIESEAGCSLNLSSSLQLEQLLFHKLQLPPVSKTPKGRHSTDSEVLKVLASIHPLPRLILNYRGVEKLQSIARSLLSKVEGQPPRIFTVFQQAATLTGRLSSVEPNLQNVPLRPKFGVNLRSCLVASPQHRWLSLDYSQIELRILAHLSQDKHLCQPLIHGEDIHRQVASELFQKPSASISASERKMAKTINFGILYGMSAFGLSRRLGMSRGQAQSMIERFFERYRGVAEYIERIKTNLSQQGKVETLMGRPWYVRQWPGHNRAGLWRAAVNAPIQGTAAELMKLAMIQISQSLKQKGLQEQVKLVLQIHDELIFEVHESQLDSIQETLKDKMEHAMELSVPLLVHVRFGAHWGEISAEQENGISDSSAID